jgi:hypothetical protein
MEQGKHMLQNWWQKEMKHSRGRWFSTTINFTGAFAKWRKAIMSFVMSACPSVRPHETIRLPHHGFLWNMIYYDFSKICLENSSYIKLWQEYPGLYMKTNAHFFIISHLFLLRTSNVSDKRCRENQKKILCSIYFLRKSCPLWYVQKYYWSGQATEDNMDHVHCMLDT